ncbi:MAG: hypothetical protein R3C58_03870 [Parvularculaceae bacterium]
MKRRLKMIASLSTLAAAGALALSGCGGEGESEGAEGEADASAISGEAESESESDSSAGGESEAAVRSGDPATDDVEFLRLLALVRGHLNAFIELQHGGEAEMARMHVKHPESELYSSLVPALEARKLPGFADELRALAAAAEEGANTDEAYSAAINAIASQEPKASVSKRLLAASEVVRVAADEFDVGVEDDGTVSNAHEYQDAYGFLIAARDLVAGAETTDVNETDALGLAHEQIEAALASFNGLTVGQTDGRSSALYGAAARIEIAARGI